MHNVGDGELRAFQELLAQYMPFDLAIDEESANGEEVRVGKTSVCGSWGAVCGEIRYFADKLGIPRASIEGTQIPMDLVRRYARAGEPRLVFDPERKRAPLALKRQLEYFGFDLGSEIEAVDQIPAELREQARQLVAEALARGEARHAAVKRNQPLIDEIRETWRRSGATTAKLGVPELASLYRSRLANLESMSDFKHVNLDLADDLESLLPARLRAEYAKLPNQVAVRDRDVDIQYDVEEVEGKPIGVAKLRLPEKLARTLTESELPTLDRPLRFVVARGARGAARAVTLEALQEELDRPFTEEELQAMSRAWEERRAERRDRKRRERGRGGAEGRPDRPHRRKQRPGRRERMGGRDGDTRASAPNEAPQTPFVEGERSDQSRPRHGGQRRRRGRGWR
jgi:hypothetical protein